MFRLSLGIFFTFLLSFQLFSAIAQRPAPERTDILRVNDSLPLFFKIDSLHESINKKKLSIRQQHNLRLLADSLKYKTEFNYSIAMARFEGGEIDESKAKAFEFTTYKVDYCFSSINDDSYQSLKRAFYNANRKMDSYYELTVEPVSLSPNLATEVTVKVMDETNTKELTGYSVAYSEYENATPIPFTAKTNLAKARLSYGPKIFYVSKGKWSDKKLQPIRANDSTTWTVYFNVKE